MLLCLQLLLSLCQKLLAPMEFTPQQLAGGMRYSRGVLVGNWSEDTSLDEERGKDFESRKSHGSSLIKQREKLEAVALQRVPWSHSADGYVRFGDSIMVRVNETDFGGREHEHFLACNIFEEVDRRKGTVQATASPSSKPTARSVFVIMRRPAPGSGLGAAAAAAAAASTRGVAATAAAAASSASGSFAASGDFVASSTMRAMDAGGNAVSGDTVLYGDRICLATNPSLRADPATGVVAPPFFLGSERPNNVLGSGRGAKQEVYLAPRAGILTEWRVGAADGNHAAVDGSPVSAGCPVTLIHCQTNQPLGAVLSEPSMTPFGGELALHALFHQPRGIVTTERARAAREPNRWTFCLAPDPAMAKDTRAFRPLTAEALLDKVRAVLKARGTYGIRALGKAFRILDDAGDGKLDREDLKWGLFDYGLRLSDEEFEMLLDAMDENGDGLISYDEFLFAVRGPLPEARRAVVLEAFAKLDKDGSGHITLEDLRTVFNSKFDEQVRSGKRTEDQALADFLSQWDTIDKDGMVTQEEFLRYYDDVSASIDSDAYFETMLRKCWGLPGADDAAAAAGLARGKWVLATLKSGGRKEVFLEGMHEVADSDKRALMDALDDAGVFGVAEVRALPHKGITAAAAV